MCRQQQANTIEIELDYCFDFLKNKNKNKNLFYRGGFFLCRFCAAIDPVHKFGMGFIRRRMDVTELEQLAKRGKLA